VRLAEILRQEGKAVTGRVRGKKKVFNVKSRCLKTPPDVKRGTVWPKESLSVSGAGLRRKDRKVIVSTKISDLLGGQGTLRRQGVGEKVHGSPPSLRQKATVFEEKKHRGLGNTTDVRMRRKGSGEGGYNLFQKKRFLEEAFTRSSKGG